MNAKPPVFATLGCRLNAYETEAMREMAEAAGLQGAVIVNTCAVTAEAVRKARQEIRRLARENPGAVVVAIVCDRGDRYLSTGVFGEESYSQGAGI